MRKFGVGAVLVAGVLAAGTAAFAEGKEVVRAEPGNLGMTFTFGGLATLGIAGDGRAPTSAPVAGVLATHVGLKYVLSQSLHIPFFFGTALALTKAPAGADHAQNWGLDMGAGIQYYFRVWRRIAPFFDLGLGFLISKPSGDSNMNFTFGLSPGLGVEYYVADRLSLTARYMFNIGIMTGGDNAPKAYVITTAAGGGMTLTYYF